jgi:hypothetical protein
VGLSRLGTCDTEEVYAFNMLIDNSLKYTRGRSVPGDGVTGRANVHALKRR